MSKPVVALQMDPLPRINVETDTTVALGLEAQNQGYKLFTYTPDALSYKEGQVVAKGFWVTFQGQGDRFYTLEEEAFLNLKEARFILMRQDPPFNMAYIAATHLLDLLPPPTRVLNNPAGVRNAPEKLLVTHFPDLMPPTLMSWDLSLIDDFIKMHGSVILKPLFDFGGNGVFLLHAGDPNLPGILEIYLRLYPEPPIFQKFLPEVAQGDKRIILIDGKPVGIYKRIPLEGQTRSNMRAGGRPGACDFSARDLEICARIGPTLKERGLYLAGIDVIGDYLTEINVTSPTGLRTINQLYGINLAKDFWERLGSGFSVLPN
ncbi:MAG: glutathione synthase [Alphaproteobacteria bacterium]|jgi:glutathione synthase|nr:glutathione synthase [Alphaproteobacteria bacterium]